MKLATQSIKMEDQVFVQVERKLKAMNIGIQQVAKFQPIQVISCEIYGGPHFAMYCVAPTQKLKK